MMDVIPIVDIIIMLTPVKYSADVYDDCDKCDHDNPNGHDSHGRHHHHIDPLVKYS